MELPAAVLAIIKQAQMSGLPMSWTASCSSNATVLTLEWSLRRKESSADVGSIEQWDTDSNSHTTHDAERRESNSIIYDQQDSGVESLNNSVMATMATSVTMATASSVTTYASNAPKSTTAASSVTSIHTQDSSYGQNVSMIRSTKFTSIDQIQFFFSIAHVLGAFPQKENYENLKSRSMQ